MGRTIPIAQVLSRMRIPRIIKSNIYFPLLKSYNEKYNFSNLKDSLDKWDSYSSSTEDCVDKMLELYSIINDKGSVKEIDEATSIIIHNIIPIKEYTDIKRQLSNIKNSDPILEAIDDIENCDRVIKNHNMISKRFNIDSYIQNHINEDANECIYNLCSFIDTYNIGVNSKFKIALEEVNFALAKNGVDIDKQDIAHSIIDYFLMNEANEEDEGCKELLNIMETTLKNNKFYNDTEYINFIRESQIDDEDKSITETFMNAKSDQIKKIVTKFKSIPKKSIPLLRSVIEKLMIAQGPNDLVNGTKSALALATYVFLVTGAFAIGFWPGIATAITASILSYNMQFKQLERVLKVWYNKRDSIAHKMEKETDPEKKKNMEEYLKTMDKNIEKLEDERDSLKGSDEKYSYENRPKNYTGSSSWDIDFDFGDFGESANTAAIDAAAVMDGIMNIKWDQNAVNETLLKPNIFLSAKLEDIDYLTEFASRFPVMINTDKMISIMQECVKDLRKNPTLTNYTRIANLQLNIQNLKEAINKLSDDDSVQIYSESTEDSDKEAISKVFDDLNDLYKYTASINEYTQAINELGLTSHFKMAIDKFSRGISALSSKEQIISRTVDGICRMVSRSIEKASTLENREAVIRGDILPSMSKCIKLVLATGIAYLINPVLALIALVGKFANDSRIRAKERQLVINELDVELIMVDKYIHKAEEENDFAKMKQYLLLKKKLQSQYARLKYKMKVEWNDHDIGTLRGHDDDN